MRRKLYAATACLMAVAAPPVADRLFLDGAKGIVFDPATPAYVHSTSEFRCHVRISPIGTRGPRPMARSSIVAIGDSFTFGWGVDAEQAWPALLGAENCGRPGIGPQGYAQIAASAVPALRPELVVVGLLQADDLAQALDPPPPIDDRSLAAALVPGTARLARSLRSPPDLGAEWRMEAASIAACRPEVVASLPEDLRRGLMVGDLNPALVALASARPRLFADAGRADLHGEDLRALRASIAAVREVCATHGARLLVVHVPVRAYVSSAGADAYAALGFDRPGPEASDASDAMVARACADEGVMFASALAAFREHQEPDRLYFPHDGHMTPDGHALLASFVASVMPQPPAPRGTR